jgi:membrane fusion protein (multidrug efflux system)
MLRKTLLVLAIASSLVACGKDAKAPEGKDNKPTQLTVAQEDVLTIQSASVSSGPVITGSIEPERRADLRAEVSAIVLQVLKENGEPVKRGDVLVRLDETSIRDTLMSAEDMPPARAPENPDGVGHDVGQGARRRRNGAQQRDE